MEEKKLKREILKEYLKSLKIETDIENTILINHNDLQGNYYCVNKQYIRLYYTKGIPEYLYEEKKKEIDNLFKQKTPRTINEEELRRLIKEELEFLKHIDKKPFLPEELLKELNKKDKTIIKEKILYEKIRINTGYKNLLLTTSPDIVILRNQQIKGIIDIKTVKTKQQEKEKNFTDIQKTIVNLLAVERRRIPKIKNPILITIKVAANSPEEQLKKKKNIIEVLEKIKNIGEKTTTKSLIHNGYNAILIKKPSTTKIIERLQALTSKEIPLKVCPYKNIKCNFRHFCKDLKVDV
jgi:hypothetical protein